MSADTAGRTVGKTAESSYARAQGDLERVVPRCRSGRAGVVFLRDRVNEWRELREARGGEAGPGPRVLGRSCRWVAYAVDVWRARLETARRAFYRWRERMKDPAEAICHVFGPYCAQAIGVARCESGHAMTPRARNGQYLGTFQMGEYERATYGHGETVLEQARAAHRYFVASGRDWSPWSCRWAAYR